ncbi:MAG: arabinofuranosyltransferase [Nocardioidaceae bacterium]
MSGYQPAVSVIPGRTVVPRGGATSTPVPHADPRRSRVLASLIAAGTSVGLVAVAAIELHGTRWSFNALYSDAGFRTEAATRFADAPALADYGYRGLPSYYPPALPWLQGRAADLVGQPAWAMMKPTMLVLAAAIPLLAYVLWRRVVPDLSAALIVLATTVTTLDLVKPDEWLVLALALPWWLELTRDIRAPERSRLQWWVHGLILGVLLLWHSYYFLPLAVATILGMAVDRLRRRRAPLSLGRAVGVALVGLVVAAPYWGPTAWLRLQGAPSDHLQMRWSRSGWEWPPWPVPVSLIGLVGLLGVGWILWRCRTDRLAESLGVGLVGVYGFYLGGQWLQRYGVAVLPEKSDDLISALLTIAGVLALREAAIRFHPRTRGRALVAAAMAGMLAVLGVVGLAGDTTFVGQRSAALHTRYPDGSYPAGGPGDPDTYRHPWGVAPGDPSVAQVSRAWDRVAGRALDGDTVLVTARADLLATSPVHPFIAWKSIYSHPAGRFAERLALLRKLGRCADSPCAANLLRNNDFDRVDGLVLNASPSGLELPVAVDTFPNGWALRPVTFSRDLFRAPDFAVRRVGRVWVIVLR